MKIVTQNIIHSFRREPVSMSKGSTLVITVVPLRDISHCKPYQLPLRFFRLIVVKLWVLVTNIAAQWQGTLGQAIMAIYTKTGTDLARIQLRIHQRILRGSNFLTELEYYHPLVFLPKVFFNKSINLYRFALFRQGAVSLLKNRKVTSVRDNLLRPGQPLRRPTE